MKNFSFRNRYLLVADLIAVLLTPAGAYALRVDSEAWSSAEYARGLLVYTLMSAVIKLVIFYFAGLYRQYWRYASVDELYLLLVANVATTAFATISYLAVQTAHILPGVGLPRSIPVLDGMLTLMAVSGLRFSVRALARLPRGNVSGQRKRVLIIGAGEAGAMILREIQATPRLNIEAVAFVDDDPTKRGAYIQNVPVLGGRQAIPKLVQEYEAQELIIAMPAAPGKIIREIVLLAEAAKVPTRMIPGIYEILEGKKNVTALRDVEIDDLLRREPVKVDPSEVGALLTGKRVMVTGAGGSIGSEICRQVARCNPALIILLGHGENSLFNIQNELLRTWPNVNLAALVADIRDWPRLEAIFNRHQPEVIFHAAAHKHVPLMEANCEDAVANNVGGTRNLLRLAESHAVEYFVLISSDKAVNPVNVMGTTKRVAEMLVQDAARRSGRHYVAVRFGNVLGSRGSVIPTFREQIARGGPVTITDPEMRRYFMTIPEAVQLVLQAAALSSGGQAEVFVLDMGEPVKIVDLARDLIELSGLELGRDIEIVYTGLRPGEKLYEELFIEGESYSRTRHAKIMVARAGSAAAPEMNTSEFEALIDALLQAAQLGQPEAVRAGLQGLVTNYLPASHSHPALTSSTGQLVN